MIKTENDNQKHIKMQITCLDRSRAVTMELNESGGFVSLEFQRSKDDILNGSKEDILNIANLIDSKLDEDFKCQLFEGTIHLPFEITIIAIDEQPTISDTQRDSVFSIVAEPMFRPIINTRMTKQDSDRAMTQYKRCDDRGIHGHVLERVFTERYLNPDVYAIINKSKYHTFDFKRIYTKQ